MKAKSNYKARRTRNGGADRYGNFLNGVQRTSDIIAGRQIWVISDKKSNSAV